MSETTKKTVETKEAAEKKPVAKAKEAKPVKEKKDNMFKRGWRKVKNGMEKHPFWTACGGAAAGSAITVGAGFGAKKIAEKRRERKYISQSETQDPNL